MKKLLLYGFLLLAVFACKKDEDEIPAPSKPEVLQGGKGGDYSMAIFTLYNSTPIAARVWIRYAAKTPPPDTLKYNGAMNTMTEPGFSHHVHFNQLKKGTYYIYAAAQSDPGMNADTVIVIQDSTAKSFDFDLELE